MQNERRRSYPLVHLKKDSPSKIPHSISQYTFDTLCVASGKTIEYGGSLKAPSRLRFLNLQAGNMRFVINTDTKAMKEAKN